ncbi:MAG: hypothetical protein HYZ00_04690 [Candidatus Hydrogenedentes bacterium]|nr:hypothetical protein [Candidatus Hydrogenedentota bacterium]
MGFLLIMKAELVKSLVISRRYWFRTLTSFVVGYGMLVLLIAGVSQTGDDITATDTAQVFTFKLDRLPAEDVFESVAGVLEAKSEVMEDGPTLTVRIMGRSDLRSEAFYSVVNRLQLHGCQLRSISQYTEVAEPILSRLTITD